MRFVVLRHEPPEDDPTAVSHWDLMLEQSHDLRTWRLGRWPLSDEPAIASPLPNHRLAFLDYEGPISGGRGSVARVAEGTYEVCSVVADERFYLLLNYEGKVQSLDFDRAPDGITRVTRKQA